MVAYVQWYLGHVVIAEASQLCRHEMMMVLFLTTSLGKKIILPKFLVDALVLLKAKKIVGPQLH